MKNKILQIFSDATIGAESTPDIKVEPNNTFYSLHNSRNNSTEDIKVEDNLETMHLVTEILQTTTMGEDMSTHPMNMRILLNAISVNLFYTFSTSVHIKKIILTQTKMINIKIKLVTNKVKMM